MNPRYRLGWTLAVCCCVLAMVGCHRAHYRASALPPELAAPPPMASRSSDLSRLAGFSADNNRIYPGDVLKINVATGADPDNRPIHYLLRVMPDGSVNTPLIGPVVVAGGALTDAEALIREAGIRRGIYRDPVVSVLLETRRTHRITVVGEVAKPGVYELPAAQSDVLAAIVAAGGLTDKAGDDVEVRQPPPPLASHVAQASYGAANDPAQLVSRTVRLHDPQQETPQSLHLGDGARVMVMKRPPQQVQVLGLVNKPGQYEKLPDQDLRMLDALAMAGGLSINVADKVHIIRRTESREGAAVIEASIAEAKRNGQANVRLQPGDVVSVEETPTTFVIGTLRDFFRIGFTSGIPGI